MKRPGLQEERNAKTLRLFAVLCRNDALFVPILTIAIASTVYVAVLPPEWLARIPTAVMDVVTGDRAELEDVAQQSAFQAQALSTELDQARVALTDAQRRIEQQLAEAAEIQKESDTLATARARIANLQVELSNAQQIAAESRSASSDLERSRQQVAELSASVRESEQRTAAVEKRLDRFRSDLAIERRDHSSSLQRLEQQAETVSTLRSDLKQSTDRTAEVKGENLRLTSRLTELEKANKSLEASLETLETERRKLEDLRTELTESGDALADAERRLAGEQTSRVNVEEAQRLREAQLRDREADVERLNVQLGIVESARSALMNTVTSQRSQTTLLSEKLTQTELELEERSRALESATQALRKVRAERGGLQNDLDEKEALLASQTDALNTSRQDLRSTAATLAERTAEASRLASSLEAGRSQLSTVGLQLSGATTAITEKDNEISKLGLEANVLAAEIARLFRMLRASSASARSAVEQGNSREESGGTANTQNINELRRFRSEFFRRLSLLLGDRNDIRMVGDRFVIQAEVLFPSASANLDPTGRRQLSQVAATLKELAWETPPGVEWVLRVDGHTDNLPINTPYFPSNWELSVARALSVVRYLVARGVPPERLSANGFGEFQPLDDTQSADAYRRNRRIELKLTER